MNNSLVKTLVAALVLACLAPIAKADDDKEAKKAVLELFEAMDLANTYEEMLTKVVDVQIKQNPTIAPFRDVMLEFFDKYMGWESMKDDMAKIYIGKFTVEEMVELKEFYLTPLGQKLSRLLPELTAEGAALGQRRVQENMGELQKMIAEEAVRIQQEEAKGAEAEEAPNPN